MPEVLVVVRGRLKDAKAASKVMAAVPRFIAASRREAGCRAYELYVSATDEAEIATIERWASLEAAQTHLAAQHTQEFLALAMECLVLAPEMRTFPLD
ncbi:putative quinol monooxygenase [Falsiroseomonas sp. HW251]|uniref:putative quinol monooxygenase n=1 Tax=Falsiroseomonas sp. HW251 TaxID=3390998 RepID=UPI003D31355D